MKRTLESMMDNLEIENKRVWAQLVAINWIKSGRKGVQQAQGSEIKSGGISYPVPPESVGSQVISEPEGKDGKISRD